MAQSRHNRLYMRSRLIDIQRSNREPKLLSRVNTSRIPVVVSTSSVYVSRRERDCAPVHCERNVFRFEGEAVELMIGLSSSQRNYKRVRLDLLVRPTWVTYGTVNWLSYKKQVDKMMHRALTSLAFSYYIEKAINDLVIELMQEINSNKKSILSGKSESYKRIEATSSFVVPIGASDNYTFFLSNSNNMSLQVRLSLSALISKRVGSDELLVNIDDHVTVSPQLYV